MKAFQSSLEGTVRRLSSDASCLDILRVSVMDLGSSRVGVSMLHPKCISSRNTFRYVETRFGISNPQTHLGTSEMHFGTKRDASRPLSSKHQDNGADGSILFIAPVVPLLAPPMPSSICINRIDISVDYIHIHTSHIVLRSAVCS
jgi:hypothetical protein